MADFFNGFWHWYIAVITVLSILGCGILTARSELSYFSDGRCVVHERLG